MLVAEIGAPGAFSLAEWQGLMAERAYLRRPPRRVARNPFAGVVGEMPVDPSVAEVIEEGRVIAEIEPSNVFDDDGCLLVYSVGPISVELRQILLEIARDLRADVTWASED